MAMAWTVLAARTRPLPRNTPGRPAVQRAPAPAANVSRDSGLAPLLPGQTCRGRSASVILTSPPLRDAEVRITTAPLRKEAQKGKPIRNRKKASCGADRTHD